METKHKEAVLVYFNKLENINKLWFYILDDTFKTSRFWALSEAQYSKI
jgi:hypothetical protein